MEGYIPVIRKRKFKTNQFQNSQNFKTANTKTIQEIKDFVKYAKKWYFLKIRPFLSTVKGFMKCRIVSHIVKMFYKRPFCDVFIFT